MPADTPALDALLRGVDSLAPWQDVTGAPFVPVHVRLAAIVRVLVEALVDTTWCPFVQDERFVHGDTARDALARAEAIAKGE